MAVWHWTYPVPSSNPAVNELPPQQPTPLTKIRFHPLPMLPPFNPEFRRIMCHRDAVGVARNLLSEDAQRASCVVVGGYQQDTSSTRLPDTSGCIPRLALGGITLCNADRNGLPWRESGNPLFRQVYEGPLVDPLMGWNI